MLNINGNNWAVCLVSSNHPELIRSDGSFTIGACDNDIKTIYILEDLPLSKMKKVLCHEITHAAMFSYNINLSIQQEELLADLIATYGQEIVYITNKIFNRIKKQGNLVK